MCVVVILVVVVVAAIVVVVVVVVGVVVVVVIVVVVVAVVIAIVVVFVRSWTGSLENILALGHSPGPWALGPGPRLVSKLRTFKTDVLAQNSLARCHDFSIYTFLKKYEQNVNRFLNAAVADDLPT